MARFLSRFLLPLLFGTALATAFAWALFRFALAPYASALATSTLQSGDFPGVTLTLDFHSSILRGTVPTPEDRSAAQASLDLTHGWGLRARSVDNHITVPPTLTRVSWSPQGLLLEGWVADDAERDALIGLAAEAGDFWSTKINAEGLQVFPFISPSGASNIATASPANSGVYTPLAWLQPLWASLPDLPEVDGRIDGSSLRLRGRLANSSLQKDLSAWVALLRPDLLIDTAGISLVENTRSLPLPDADGPPPSDHWLHDLWTRLQTRPRLTYRAPSSDSGPLLSGLVPGSGDWLEKLNPQDLPGDLAASPASISAPEDLSPDLLAALLELVSQLREGFLDYSPDGLVIRGGGEPDLLASLRALDFSPLPAPKISFQLDSPFLAIFDGPTVLLHGSAPSESARDLLLAWLRVLRPDLTLDGSGITIQTDSPPWDLPSPEGDLSVLLPDLEDRFPWFRSLLAQFRSGPQLEFSVASPDQPPLFWWLGPIDPAWAAALLPPSDSGASPFAAFQPGGLTSPLISTASPPRPEFLAHLLSLVAHLSGGYLLYHPESGLTVRGEGSQDQLAAIRSLDFSPLDPSTLHLELAQAAATAAKRTIILTGIWKEGSLLLSGSVPEDAQNLLLAAVRQGAPGANVETTNLAPKPLETFPPHPLAAQFARHIVSAPGHREFQVAEDAIVLRGEMTDALLLEWKPTFDLLEDAGFALEAGWEIFPSVFHFPSYVGGMNLPEKIREALASTLKGNEIFFDTNRSIIRPSERPKIDAICRAVKEVVLPIKFVIGGHADQRGSPQRNQVLSRARAESVVAALQACGLDPAHFTVESFGATKATGSDPASLAYSRRVEILLE